MVSVFFFAFLIVNLGLLFVILVIIIKKLTYILINLSLKNFYLKNILSRPSETELCLGQFLTFYIEWRFLGYLCSAIIQLKLTIHSDSRPGVINPNTFRFLIYRTLVFFVIIIVHHHVSENFSPIRVPFFAFKW